MSLLVISCRNDRIGTSNKGRLFSAWGLELRLVRHAGSALDALALEPMGFGPRASRKTGELRLGRLPWPY
jgi:hypothetical protein